jgi:hypothetical protein
MLVCAYSVFVEVAALRWADPHPMSPTNCLKIKKLKWNKRFTDALCSKVGETGKGEREGCHEDICGSGGIARPFLTSAVDRGELSASRKGRFTSEERASGTHWMGGWVGFSGDLNAVEKGEGLPLIEPGPSGP